MTRSRLEIRNFRCLLPLLHVGACNLVTVKSKIIQSAVVLFFFLSQRKFDLAYCPSAFMHIRESNLHVKMNFTVNDRY